MLDHIEVQRDGVGRILRVLAYDAQHDHPVHLPITDLQFLYNHSNDGATGGKIILTMHGYRTTFVEVDS